MVNERAAVEASSNYAGVIYSSTLFRIPAFQRDYKWTTDQVGKLWEDFRSSIDQNGYFLGLLVLTDDDLDRRSVVDGQQRLVTVALLASALRRLALREGRRLVANAMQDTFLQAVDLASNTYVSRIEFSSELDRDTFTWLTADEASEPRRFNVDMAKAHGFFDQLLDEDIAENGPSRVSQWALFLTGKVNFAVFDHPSKNAAFKVFEVINTRGLDLTPAELIKANLVGVSSGSATNVLSRWNALEERFTSVNAEPQFTQFLRHVTTLRLGYVEPGDLYERLSSQISSRRLEVGALLESLEENIDAYIAFVDPNVSDDAAAYDVAAEILFALGLRTVRPTFLALQNALGEDAFDAYSSVMRILVPRIVVGGFGTGSVERRFSIAATDVQSGKAWEPIVETLSRSLMPSRAQFRNALQERQSRGTLLVLRNALLQSTLLPRMEGFIHFVRQANAIDWPDFDDQEFAALGGTIGNSMLSKAERRPRGTSTLHGAVTRLVPTRLVGDASVQRQPDVWDARSVAVENDILADHLTELWYG